MRWQHSIFSGVPTLDEETARAEVYGLLAALYYAPPSPELLEQLRVAVTEAPAAGGFLEEPWREVVAATRDLGNEAVCAATWLSWASRAMTACPRPKTTSPTAAR